MLLIATDEAGYGPKLGPLVVVATAWRLPDAVAEDPSQQELDDLFACIREPTECGGAKVVVDDSKAVYQSKGKDGLKSLHAAVSAAMRWIEPASGCVPAQTLDQWLPQITPEDREPVLEAPWLRHLSDEAFLRRDTTSSTTTQWSMSGVQLNDIAARIITASKFNEACESGLNKADLLSEMTLALVRRVVESSAGTHSSVHVFCDRHGGRRFYGGVLQHTFNESPVEMVAESKQQSIYRFGHDGISATIRFTVKGDSFTPVAMSSIIAKYLRERMMQSLNSYFESLNEADTPLKPTAGYPVDADRYLAEIAPIIEKQKINQRDLIRQR